MQSSTWLRWIIERPWILELAILMFILFFLNVVLNKIFSRSKKMSKLKESDWRFYIEYTAVSPARTLLWVLLITFSIDLTLREFSSTSSFTYIASLRNAAIVLCLSWFLLRWKKVFHKIISFRSERRDQGILKIDSFMAEIIGKIFTVVVVFITLLILMQILGLNILPLIAFGGIGAAALGIAGKDVISNFFGGFMIYLTRPFMVGDLIEIPHRKITGNIEEIGWYLTCIRDLHKRPIYVPNAVFSTEPLMNLSRMTHRRIEESIAVQYSDFEKIPLILEEIKTLFEHNPSIDHHQSICVFLERFTESSIQIEIKAYALCTRYDHFMQTRLAIMTQVYKIIKKAGIEQPLTTMQIKMI